MLVCITSYERAVRDTGSNVDIPFFSRVTTVPRNLQVAGGFFVMRVPSLRVSTLGGTLPPVGREIPCGNAHLTAHGAPDTYTFIVETVIFWWTKSVRL